MSPPRFTIGRLLLIIAAFSVGLSSLQGNYLWFMGLSMVTTIVLLFAALGAESGAGRPGPSSPHF